MEMDLPTAALSEQASEPDWPDLPRGEIAKRLVTIHCVGQRGSGPKAIGFNLVLIRRTPDSAGKYAVPVRTQFYDEIVSAPLLGAGHLRTMQHALEVMRKRRPDWTSAHLHVETTFWEVDQVVTQGSLKRTSQALVQRRRLLQGELQFHACTRFAVTWSPKRRTENGAQYRKLFAQIDLRLNALLKADGVVEKDRLWVDLYAIGETVKRLTSKGKSPTLLEALAYHCMRQRKRKGVEVAEALRVPVKKIHSANERAIRKWRAAKAEESAAISASVDSGTFDADNPGF